MRSNKFAHNFFCPNMFNILSLKFHEILLNRSGDRGFVFIEKRESVVLVKMNDMALKVPHEYKLTTKIKVEKKQHIEH